MTTGQFLEQIRNGLIAEAEQALARAEQYQHSKRQGLRNSVPVYVSRGEVALGAVALLDQMPEPQARRAYAEVAPRRALTTD